MTIDEVAGREEFAAFLEVVPDAIVGVSDDGAILFVNSLAASLFGRERSELIDEPIELLIPRSFRDVLSRGQNSEAPHTLLHVTGHRKDGSEFPAEISWMSAQPGGKLMFTAAIRNITRRKPHKATFRGVVEAAEDAAVGVDGTGHIALVNEEAEELFGYTRTELIDQPLDMLVPGQVGPPNRPQRVDGRVNRRVGAGKPLEGRRKDGSEFPVEISLSAIDTDDGPLVSAAIRDASDRVESRREEDRATVQNERDVLEF